MNRKNHRNSRKKKKKIDDIQHNNCTSIVPIDGRIRRVIQSVLYSPDYIFKKVFRKDGPPLGTEFDVLPSNPFPMSKRRSAKVSSRKRERACQENQKALKRRKVYDATTLDSQICVQNTAPVTKHGKGKGPMAVLQATNLNVGDSSLDFSFGEGDICPLPASTPNTQHANEKKKGEQIQRTENISKTTIPNRQICEQHSAPVKKHGKGKGLMSVLQLTNYAARDFYMDVDYADGAMCSMPPVSKKAPVREKKKRVQRKKPVVQKLKKLQEKRKPSVRKKVASRKPDKQMQPRKDRCELVIEGSRCNEHRNRFTMLLDDEELELRELQAGPNPLSCSAHFASNAVHGCSFCKDLLAKFPPNSVAMKQALCMQPWDSSPDLVKKFFKIFHFLYTYAARIHMYSFTIDDFAQAFDDKDSLLLGRINMALLSVLLSDVELELSNGFIPHVMKNSNFVGLLNSVKDQNFVLNLWKKSLNSMTWTEILRQVLIAAGFGLKHGSSPSGALSKEFNLMSEYGLRPGTLKGELFSILSLQGNNGSKVSELAKSTSIVELNLAARTDELELLISSMLSSDITLFEKIASSAYRLRINSVANEREDDLSDLEDFGSVDDDSEDGGRYSSSDDSECNSRSPTKVKKWNREKNKSEIIAVDTEIDESHPGELWLLGLTEGEYFDLSIDEKLNTLVVLIDLVSAGSTIRMEEPVISVAECAPDLNRISSGGKIKRSTVGQQSFSGTGGAHVGQAISVNLASSGSSLEPVDSLATLSDVYGKEKSSNINKDTSDLKFEDVHPMRSIYLGSDRRYNRYWLFLGPCNDFDPGHKRIYFESSEDGQWEVIDTEESLRTLSSALDCRGAREACLLSSLEKVVAHLHHAMSSIPDGAGSRQPTQSDHSDLSTLREDSSSVVSDVDNNMCLSEIGNVLPVPTFATVLHTEKRRELQKQKWSRLQAFDLWVWKSFYLDLNAVKHGKKSFLDSLARCEHCHDLYWRDEKHCRICHTTFELDFDIEERYAIHAATCRTNGDNDVFPKHKVLPSQLQSLKAAVYAIESVMPEDALVGTWTRCAHNLWIKRLRRTSTLPEFLQVLSDFVTSINEDWLHQCNSTLGSDSLTEEITAAFQIMPQTSSAVALWVVKLDNLIAPHIQGIQSKKDKQLCTRSKGKARIQ